MSDNARRWLLRATLATAFVSAGCSGSNDAGPTGEDPFSDAAVSVDRGPSFDLGGGGFDGGGGGIDAGLGADSGGGGDLDAGRATMIEGGVRLPDGAIIPGGELLPDGAVRLPDGAVIPGGGESDAGGGFEDLPNPFEDVADPVTDPDATTPGGERCGDGLDNNMNGQVDEGCWCLPGRAQRCYLGNPANAGRGICGWGTQSCSGVQVDGEWGPCTGSVAPRTESCNQQDDNCNGAIDESCPCAPGATRSCYSGPSGTLGRGLCRGGTQLCGTGGVWGGCSGEVTPDAERCDGQDRDCDGNVMNGCSCNVGDMISCFTGPSASAMVGACRPGRQLCSPLDTGGAAFSACSGEVLPTAEICDDNIDNDCNGTRDCDDQDCRGAPNCIPGCRMGAIGEVTPHEAQIVIVADRSGSMEARTSDGSTRWGALRTAVNAVLPRLDGSFEIGAAIFPVGDTCGTAPTGLNYPPLRGGGTIIREFLNIWRPGGATPTEAALRGVRGWYAANPSTTPRFVLLATDGAPNCGSGVGQVVSELSALRGMQIDTFVLGIPGPRDALNQMAQAGGRPLSGGTAFYEANNTAQLAQALRQITAAVANCEYEIPSPPAPIADQSLLRITFDGVDVPRGSNGWSLSGAGSRNVRFAGAACDTLRAGNVRRIAALYNCR